MATLHLLPRAQDGEIAAGGGGRIVGRPDDPPLGLQDREDLAPPVDVVAHRDAVDAGGDQLVVDVRRQSRAAGGVLGVGHHQVEVLLGAQPAHGLRADVPAGLAHDVADEEDSHERDWGLGIRD